MLRKDREVTDLNEIFGILERCETVRIGISGGDFPYVVPVSFGAILENGKITVYFHGAKRGLKADLLEKNTKVCVEADVFIKTEETERGITARYESVIGFGRAERISGGEKSAALEKICSHYGYENYNMEKCGVLTGTEVWKITLEEATGKRNLG